MKIPVYQKQISYQAAPIRRVELAKPLLQASGDSKWDKLQLGAQVAKDALTVSNFLTHNFEQDSRQQKRAAAADGQTADTSAAAEGQPYGFSSPLRSELLAFGRREIFSAADEKGTSAVEKLDDYFSGKYAEMAAQQKDPQAALATQDYVILRRELTHLQQQQQQQEKQEAFANGAGAFLEQAALIRTAGALENYMQANLQAAHQQALTDGISEAQWQAEKAYLSTQAVEHNLTAALQAGEVTQAQAVYAHFETQLPPARREQWQEKFLQARAQQAAQYGWEQLEKQAEQQGSTLQAAQLSQWAEEHFADNKPLAERVEQSLQAHWQAQQTQQWQAQAAYYEKCLQMPQEAGEPSWRQTPQASRLTQQLLQTYQTGGGAHTEPSAFNSLYEAVEEGRAQETHIEQGYQEGKLSAADTLRLKQLYCDRQANGADPRRQLIVGALQHFCRQYDLPESLAQQAQYVVCSAGAQWPKQLAAAQEVKQMISLQEKKK